MDDKIIDDRGGVFWLRESCALLPAGIFIDKHRNEWNLKLNGV